MDPLHEALARSRAYLLFSRLYLDGLTPELLTTVNALDVLSAQVPTPTDTEEVAADHYHLFGLNVFPYASLFLGTTGRLGGPITEALREQYLHGGYVLDASRESDDHLGHTLGFLAHLTGAEADARSDHLPLEAERMRKHQARFIDHHLLCWLPVLVQALRRQPFPFFATLAELTLDLVVDHRAILSDVTHPPDEATFLPELPPLLDQSRTGIKELATYLTTPAWSGLYLSRDDIAHLGRSERLPRGFGPRALMLTNLLRSAAEFDLLEPLLHHLDQLVASWHRYYQSLVDQNVPPLTLVARTWLERLAATAMALNRLRVATSR